MSTGRTPTTRLDLEYDGAAFAGWARQPGKRTVQGEIETVLARLLPERVDLTVAGRTDRGVHASGQVASYSGPPAARKGLNALLPPDIAVTAVCQAPEGFDARRDALSRSYRYRVRTSSVRSVFDRGRVLDWPYAVDRPALDACAAALVGTHDLTAFTPAETAHRLFRRTVLSAAWVDAPDDVLAFEIEARSFMRSMNRVLVGTMLEVACARRTVESFVALLSGALREDAGPTAIADGLALTGVRYPEELAFTAVPERRRGR